MTTISARREHGAAGAGRAPVSVPRRVAWTGRAVAGLVLAIVILLLSTGRADAHTGFALPPATNLRTNVIKVVVPIAGVEAAAVDLGDQLELRGVPATDLVVLGYQDEPMVRTAPSGVYVNARSPSLGGDPDFASLQRDPDPQAAPEWVLVGGPGAIRWHDHRAHWMGVGDPPAAADAPEQEHVIVDSWTVPLVAGTERGEISGDLRWEPPPASWPWLLLATTTLVAVLVPLLLGRARRSVLAASFVLAASAAVVIAGWVIDGGGTTVQVIAACLPAVAGVILLGVLAIGTRSPVNRGGQLAIGLVAAALIVVPVAPLVFSAPFGSQVATSWSPVVVRAAAALLVGSAAGLVFALVAPMLTAAPPAGRPGRVRRPPLLRLGGRGATGDRVERERSRAVLRSSAPVAQTRTRWTT